MDRAKHNKTIAVCGLALILSLVTGQAGTLYDVKIERAAMDLIARRIGSIRPGLAYDVGEKQLIAPARQRSAEPPPLASARRANEFWRQKDKVEAAKSKSIGSFQMIGDAAETPAGDARPPRRGAIPKVLKF